jgi:N-acyl amino acid synthase of PEP-CTERM/exosortase system
MSIVNAFNTYFEMIPADTDELREEVYKLRYQVYCLEKGFLQDREDGVEHDEYDQYSSHYLIRHRASDCYMATTRLILPDRQHPEKLFPLEAYNQIEQTELIKNIRRNSLGEMSRFCVSKQFRRRANEKDIIITNEALDSRPQKEKAESPNLTLALFACAIRMSSEHNIHHWYAIMEPTLRKVIAALGINFVQLGPAIPSEHYYGLRAPYVIKVNDLLNDVAEKDLDHWNFLTHFGQYIFKI